VFGNIFHSDKIERAQQQQQQQQQENNKNNNYKKNARKKSQRNWPKIGNKPTTTFRLSKMQQVAKYLHSDAQWQLKCNVHSHTYTHKHTHIVH